MSAKTLLITGASSGIGRATAKAAADAGWNVALFARSADKLDKIAAEIGERALAIPGDATQLEEQESAVARTVDRFGGLDAAFANAGMGLQTPGTMQGDPEEWRRLIDLNVMGLLYTARAALPALKKTKGHLVLTGSAAGRRHIAGSIYGATKWFVHGYAGNMAEEMREWGGRCTVIAPGMVNTAFFEQEKPEKLQPEDVANAVMHALLADPRAAVREIYLMPQN
ncbi:SDR family oxidoreductase [Brevirhabdus sp.]|uniref:SDR family oxidoreductase n=1 Tax=Brevirhabdus sp. TaxID=2004514 RepID=UPI004059ACF2